MGALGRPSISVNRYLHLPPELKLPFDAWLKSEGLDTERITCLKLGDGFVWAMHYPTSQSKPEEQVVVRYPIKTQPPEGVLR